ncbi:MAG TPA: phosphatidate cytidylyltransferase [Gemmatimonadaceae bacterium]|nr:phosphatidate cytidylyltransferase [Gemmatimonadaceae bacterium]
MPRSELATRVLASLVLVPLVLAAGWFGDWALAALLSIASALGAWEYFRIARAAGHAPFAGAGIALAALIPLSVHARYLGLPGTALDAGTAFGPAVAPVLDPLLRALTAVLTLSMSGAAVILLALLAASLVRRGTTGKPLGAVAVTVTGALYTGGMLSFAYALRYHPYAVGAAAGAVVLLFPLIITWVTDTGAYFVGRAVGRRKLMPSVSPGKSIEGAFGGLVAAMAAAWLYERYALAPVARLAFYPGAVILFGAIVSAAGQVGDLVESLLKREAGVKDSSRIIPGHGGVLDRVDSLLFTVPVAYWLLTILRLYPVPG